MNSYSPSVINVCYGKLLTVLAPTAKYKLPDKYYSSFREYCIWLAFVYCIYNSTQLQPEPTAITSVESSYY